MYLSSLLIDVGTNPDRPRPGRLWLRNLYRVHQRLCMAFPDANDPQQDKHVHVPRADKNGFLFRVDPRPGANPVILVQSACRPDWDSAFHNAEYLLAAEPEVREVDPCFTPNQRLRFRIKANPVKRAREDSRNEKGQPLDAKWAGKRIPVPQAATGDWLARRAKPAAGFQLVTLASAVPGYVYFNRTGERGVSQRLFFVLFDGVLQVTDPAAFTKILQTGIGPAKAFGFGLLSVAPLRE